MKGSFPHDKANKTIDVPENLPGPLGEKAKVFIHRWANEPLFRRASAEILHSEIMRNKSVIDIGSYISDNSIAWATAHPDKFIYAIDPAATNIAFGEVIAFANELKNIMHIQKVCSDKPGEALSFSGDIDHASFFSSSSSSADLLFSSTIDQTIPRCEHSNIGFFHIDVEGFELNCILGAQTVITESAPVIVFEQHISKEHQTTQEILDLLADMGYKFYLLNENTGLQPDCRNILAVPAVFDSDLFLSADYSEVNGETPSERPFEGGSIVPIGRLDGRWMVPKNEWDEEYLFPALKEERISRDFEKSLSILDTSMKFFPNSGTLIFNAIRIMHSNGIYEDSLELCSSLRGMSANSIAGYLATIDAFLNIGDLDSALKYSSESLAVHPSSKSLVKKGLTVCNSFASRLKGDS